MSRGPVIRYWGGNKRIRYDYSRSIESDLSRAALPVTKNGGPTEAGPEALACQNPLYPALLRRWQPPVAFLS